MNNRADEIAQRVAAVVAATAPADPRRAGRDVARLSRLFGEERSQRRADYFNDPALRAAYLAFFVPQYAAKIALLLQQAHDDGLLDLPPNPRVLDVGAGPPTGILGPWIATG